MKFSECIGMNGSHLLDTDSTLDRLRWLRIQILDIMDIIEQTDDETVVRGLFDMLDGYIAAREKSDDFANFVAAVLDRHRIALAAEFEVAESTVDRWASGAATPLPRLQAEIVRFIKRLEDGCGRK